MNSGWQDSSNVAGEQDLHEHLTPILGPNTLCFHAVYWKVDRERGDKTPSAEMLESECQLLCDGLNQDERLGTWMRQDLVKSGRTCLAYATSQDVAVTSKITTHTEYLTLSLYLTFVGSGPGTGTSVCAMAREALFSPLDSSSVCAARGYEENREALFGEFIRMIEMALQKSSLFKARIFLNAFVGVIFHVPQEGHGHSTSVPLSVPVRQRWRQTTGVARFKDPMQSMSEMWPVIECIHNAKDPLVELVACTFLKQRVIYCSSLGNPADGRYLPLKVGEFGVINVAYSLFVAFDDPWQLGRLVDNIHALGTLRNVALQEKNEISKTVFKIKKFAKSNDRDNVDNEVHTTGILRDASLQEKNEILKTAPNKAAFSKENNRVDDSIIKQKRGILPDIESMEYRIERSVRYWQQFKQRLTRLRSKRIEGFQPYPEFVQRRIGDTIGFIHGCGNLFRVFRANLDLLEQESKAQQISDNTKNLKRLQERAEILLFIPIVYYAKGIFESIFDLFLDEKRPSIYIFGYTFDKNILCISFAVATTFLIYHIIRRKDEKK